MNLLIEESLQSWLRSLEAFDGLAVHTGQSNDEIPGDQPVLIVGCDQVELVGGPYHKASATILLSTPSHLDLDQHRALVTALRQILKSSSSTGMAESFTPSATLAGAVLNSFSESQSDARWVCTASITLGVVEI